jgi:hypothetical protein
VTPSEMGPVLLLWRYDLILAVLGLAALVCVLRDSACRAERDRYGRKY